MAENVLLQQVVQLSGLPEELIAPRLQKWIHDKGYEASQMNLEELREFLVELVRDIFQEI